MFWTTLWQFCSKLIKQNLTIEHASLVMLGFVAKTKALAREIRQKTTPTRPQ